MHLTNEFCPVIICVILSFFYVLCIRMCFFLIALGFFFSFLLLLLLSVSIHLYKKFLS